MTKEEILRELPDLDLVIDKVYGPGEYRDKRDEVLGKLMMCENSGWFRVCGSKKAFSEGKYLKKDNKPSLNYVVIFSTGDDPNWLNDIDLETGVVLYYGDNQEPGVSIHGSDKSGERKVWGNRILRQTFELLHQNERKYIPPFFLFTKEKNAKVRFRGLLVPGNNKIKPTEDLVAIWNNKDGIRYQNYKSIFTILNIEEIPRQWIIDLKNGEGYKSKYAPTVWKNWIEHGKYSPLTSVKTKKYRKPMEQIPDNKDDIYIIEMIHSYFKNGYAFEPCAVAIAEMMDKNIVNCNLTPRIKDKGKDATGEYRIGLPSGEARIKFSLEAKRYKLDHAVGVEDVSRLISKIRHREFGIMVTTSYISEYAYKEIVEEESPIVVIAAIDIITILKDAGYKSSTCVYNWLSQNFSRD